MFTDIQLRQASEILEILKEKNLKLATAESCTGGLISALFTEIPGSSAVFECGFVTYSNESKIKILRVDPDIIKKYGAVSEQVAAAMAKGATANTFADIAVSVTGIAGPSGGSPEKPVGTVYIAVATKNKLIVKKNLFSGNREQIRVNSVEITMNMIREILMSADKGGCL